MNRCGDDSAIRQGVAVNSPSSGCSFTKGLHVKMHGVIPIFSK